MAATARARPDRFSCASTAHRSPLPRSRSRPSSTTRERFVIDARGIALVTFPRNFVSRDVSGGSGHAGHGPPRAGFVLAVTHDAKGRHYLTAFNHSYSPHAFEGRSLWSGLASSSRYDSRNTVAAPPEQSRVTHSRGKAKSPFGPGPSTSLLARAAPSRARCYVAFRRPAPCTIKMIPTLSRLRLIVQLAMLWLTVYGSVAVSHYMAEKISGALPALS